MIVGPTAAADTAAADTAAVDTAAADTAAADTAAVDTADRAAFRSGYCMSIFVRSDMRILKLLGLMKAVWL